MNPFMRKELDAIMETPALDTGSASHPSDRKKLRDLFIRWSENGVVLSVADWEAYLKDRGWKSDAIREVVELPEDVAAVARHYGHL